MTLLPSCAFTQFPCGAATLAEADQPPSMRLRIQIWRNDLPVVKVVWQALSTRTIVELLKEINDFIPLESDTWDCSDYLVSAYGYEALHFQTVENVFKEDDEVL